uniref:Uncharacterized protein n=1 Tax=Rhizophora mucronata TaxID=61149 RepID=A0A2P2KMW8_RHIMU
MMFNYAFSKKIIYLVFGQFYCDSSSLILVW